MHVQALIFAICALALSACASAPPTTFVDATEIISYKQPLWWSAGGSYFTPLDLRSQIYQTIHGIQRSSVDYYASMRNLYRQLRANDIRNGRPATKAQPAV